MDILYSYLPRNSVQNSNSNNLSSGRNNFSESGAYFALGLINACKRSEKITNYLLEEFDNSSLAPTLQHGLAAGLGLSAGLSHNQEIIEKLKSYLFSDESIVGLSSGIAIGLIAAGGCQTFSEEFRELLEFSLETSHEKTMLGCGIGQALMIALQPEFFELSDVDSVILVL